MRDWLRIVRRAGEHLLTLINDVLDLTKIESGKTELVVTDLNLRALVQTVAAMWGVRAQEKGSRSTASTMAQSSAESP